MTNTEKRYEDYTPRALAELRDQGTAGNAMYASLRENHTLRGSPAIRSDASDVPPQAAFAQAPADLPRFECFTPGAWGTLRNESAAGAATYFASRSVWEDAGRPPMRGDASSVPPAVHPSAQQFIATQAAAVDPSKKYEDYTAREMSDMRSNGTLDKNAYAALRQTWLRDGQPPVKLPAV